MNDMPFSDAVGYESSLKSRGYGAAIYGGDEALHVEFSKDLVFSSFKNSYDSKIFIKIFIPGNKSSVYREAKPEDYTRFAKQWEMFQKYDANPIIGTPLAKWPEMNEQLISVCHSLKIYTVEQLASVDDTVLPRIGMDSRDLRQRARAYLEATAKNAPYKKIEDENEALKKQVQDLSAQVGELLKVMAQKAQEEKPRIKKEKDVSLNGS